MYNRRRCCWRCRCLATRSRRFARCIDRWNRNWNCRHPTPAPVPPPVQDRVGGVGSARAAGVKGRTGRSRNVGCRDAAGQGDGVGTAAGIPVPGVAARGVVPCAALRDAAGGGVPLLDRKLVGCSLAAVETLLTAHCAAAAPRGHGIRIRPHRHGTEGRDVAAGVCSRCRPGRLRGVAGDAIVLGRGLPGCRQRAGRGVGGFVVALRLRRPSLAGSPLAAVRGEGILSVVIVRDEGVARRAPVVDGGSPESGGDGLNVVKLNGQVS